MKRAALALAACLVLLPALALAAAAPSILLDSSHTLVTGAPAAGNQYVTAGSVVSASPVAGDLSAAGGSVIVGAPVAGDALIAGGSIELRAPITGDARLLGGTISISDPIGGDLAALGFSVKDTTRASGSVYVAAAEATLTGGAGGPVVIYGNNVSLGGAFAGDVNVVASGRVALAASTTIRGAFTYEAPEPALIPISAKIEGPVTHTTASYLPASSTVHALAFASIGIFFFARILGSLILAGLLAGLFPFLAESVVARAYGKPRSVLLSILLGFAFLVATPILCILIALTFIGFGLALLLGISYALLALLAYVYAAILLGGAIARRFFDREQILWSDGVVGMLVFSLILAIPYIGATLATLLITFAAGSLLVIFFHHVFPRE